MNTNELLRQMETAAFGPFFYKEIGAIFEGDVEAGRFEQESKEYTESMHQLQELLSEERITLLTEYEALCLQIRDYSAKYGFIAGIYCGFKQILTSDREHDGGFGKYVADDVALQPKMMRHTQNYANINRRNDVYRKIVADAPERVREAMVPVECYWSQVAHSASLNGFYCGYRAAGGITDTVALTENNYMFRVSKQLTMEHALGYIESFSEMEQRMDREYAEKVSRSESNGCAIV